MLGGGLRRFRDNLGRRSDKLGRGRDESRSNSKLGQAHTRSRYNNTLGRDLEKFRCNNKPGWVRDDLRQVVGVKVSGAGIFGDGHVGHLNNLRND